MFFLLSYPLLQQGFYASVNRRTDNTRKEKYEKTNNGHENTAQKTRCRSSKTNPTTNSDNPEAKPFPPPLVVPTVLSMLKPNCLFQLYVMFLLCQFQWPFH